jgi:septal ring factor EnvC (AmiA/AmiB activator)
MKSLSLILRIVAILAAAAAVALFFTSKGKLAEKQTELEQAQAVTQATKGELETANGQIASLETQLSTERKSLADTKGKLESVRSEMYTAKQEVTRTQQQLRETKSTIADLEDTATRLREDLVKTEKSLASASKESEIAELNDRIEELAKANDTLKQDLIAAEAYTRSRPRTAPTSRTQTGTGDYKSSFSPSMAPPVQPASIGTETTIASISSNDGIIVLDTTAELGLSAGSQITLVQGFKALGKIQITEVTEKFAIANILPGTSTRGLSAGATVKLLR